MSKDEAKLDLRFEFDAPHFVDFREIQNSPLEYIDNWFKVPHKSHELNKTTKKRNDSTNIDRKLGMPKRVQFPDKTSQIKEPVQEDKKLKESNMAKKSFLPKSGKHSFGKKIVPLRKTQVLPSASSSKSTSTSSVSHSSAKNSGKVVKRKRVNAADKKAEDEFKLLQNLLAQHNKKFKPAHTYEPRQHSVRDMRMWEKKNNKMYYDLTSEERQQANEDISKSIAQRLANKK